jgi:hypothetical protein
MKNTGNDQVETSIIAEKCRINSEKYRACPTVMTDTGSAPRLRGIRRFAVPNQTIARFLEGGIE